MLEDFSIDGYARTLGFGWLGSYIVISGSPVAAIALSLFAGGALTDIETFAMINGSRMGASLIVLVVGFVSYVTGRRNPDGLYIGVVALLTAITLWAPVMPLGLFILDRGLVRRRPLRQPGRADVVRRRHLRPDRRPPRRPSAAAGAVRRSASAC